MSDKELLLKIKLIIERQTEPILIKEKQHKVLCECGRKVFSDSFNRHIYTGVHFTKLAEKKYDEIKELLELYSTQP